MLRIWSRQWTIQSNQRYLQWSIPTDLKKPPSGGFFVGTDAAKSVALADRTNEAHSPDGFLKVSAGAMRPFQTVFGVKFNEA